MGFGVVQFFTNHGWEDDLSNGIRILTKELLDKLVIEKGLRELYLRSALILARDLPRTKASLNLFSQTGSVFTVE